MGNLAKKNIIDSKEEHNIMFDELIYTKPGVYNYTIKEISKPAHGWKNDDKIYRVIIKVTESDFGNLTVDAHYPDGIPEFTNKFSCTPTKVSIFALKRFCGFEGRICQLNFKFKFGIFNEQNEMIDSAYNIEQIIEFKKLTFKFPGVFNYTIKEISGCSHSWKSDKTVFPVTIIVTLDKCGQLIASTLFPKGMPIFINYYKDDHC